MLSLIYTLVLCSMMVIFSMWLCVRERDGPISDNKSNYDSLDIMKKCNVIFVVFETMLPLKWVKEVIYF